MKPGDIIAIVIALGIVVGAVLYIIKQKKKGKRCIGCPDGGCSCCQHAEKKNNCCCSPKK